MSLSPAQYRGRIAPSPTGLLHLGHARTFWIAQQRARAAHGTLVFRNDDLDRSRGRREFLQAAYQDLGWLGITWSEGPDRGGAYTPYTQSERLPLYRTALEKLHQLGLIFPCTHSRRDVLAAIGAPHENAGEGDEGVYPLAFRPDPAAPLPRLENALSVNWRFRVPVGEKLTFTDCALGPQSAIAGEDFGDFILWRKDDLPSYQLACVVDDSTMRISEVVRGADLITSTFRQLLLYRALDQAPPAFFHCALLRDEQGERLAKRHDALSLKALREHGTSPESLVKRFAEDYLAQGS